MSDRPSRVIGLTGGIATGKSTVAKYIADTHKIPILDADIYARDAVEIGSPILVKIVERYGKSILLTDGNLDRKQLGEIIFQDSSMRQWIEELIHPYVRDRFVTESAKLNQPTGVFVIPLLFEAKMTDLVTETWVVYCTKEQQLQRLIQRNSLTLREAESRISAQMPLEEKCQLADVILDNSGTPAALEAQILQALNRSIALH
ncbi:dephospho-CoA kinase [Merismopedia glauca]|uniref:Dephospho-CoA kinase n=1 Tax=Merismopedia glauca CCAP 1448/3 TaxID=1296344 RepID=A0A2T1C6G5_9CYAN|nr:dephospho-CoA kinase [Merismopedia glauca]PSB03824.1 dephospho-CoA kinase [Merismopedia glauca CCAP 1448/3]